MSKPPAAGPKDRHAALVRELSAHEYRYYVLDDPTATDAEYDTRMNELKALEAAHPELVTPDSPTQRVGGEARTDVVKVKRRERMFSLDNAYSAEDIGEFVRRVKTGLPDRETPLFVVEPKLDGASIEVVYEDGRLAQASTRGDGETGEDITVNLRTVRGVPSAIEHRARLTLRGEVVIYRKDLDSLNAERAALGLEPYANPRNAAAGAVRMLDPREVARRPLRALFYQALEGAQLRPTHAETLDYLGTLGLPTHRRHVVTAEDGVMAAILAIDGARAGYPFETDGAVVKVDAYRQQDMLGATSKFPKWAVAYKFAAEQAETLVRAIVVQVGRTGVLTPVAELDPVELAGTTVSRATLHNEGMIAELDVRPLDRVVVQKAGEIIPQVMSVVPGERHAESIPFTLPDRCPECGTPVVRGEQAAVRCPNVTCPAQVRGSVYYFSRRFAMDVDHLGISLVEQLTASGRVKDVADLYELTRDDLLALERIGDKTADNVVLAIDTSRGRTLDRLICGLGIPQIGQIAARQLAESAVTLATFLSWADEAVAAGAEARLAREAVGQIRGFGPKMVDSVVEWLGDARHRDLLAKLSRLEVSVPQPLLAIAAEGPLVGAFFCVTGVLSRKREDVHADIRAAGGQVHESVKKDTTYLVAGEKTGKSKLDQSRKFGVRVIDEAALAKLLRGEELPPIEAPPPKERPVKEEKAKREKKAKKVGDSPPEPEGP